MVKQSLMVRLNTIDKVKTFANIVNKFDASLDLHSGRYVIDAKSIMGIFSLDLSKDIELNISAYSTDELALIVEKLNDYIVKPESN